MSSDIGQLPGGDLEWCVWCPDGTGYYVTAPTAFEAWKRARAPYPFGLCEFEIVEVV